MNFGIIYKAKNKYNGKIYIGQTTKHLKTRMKQHKYNKKNAPFPNAMRKYGVNGFFWSILEVCDSEHDLNLAEEWYILYYKSLENGYNLTLGGEGCHGYRHSDDVLVKMSNSMKGKNLGKKRSSTTKKKLSKLFSGQKNPMYGKCGDLAPNYGRKFSKSTKLKMSKSQMGKNNSFYGRRHSEATKLSMSINRSGEKSPLFGKHMSQSTKDKISKGNSKKYSIITPDGKCIDIVGICKFSKTNNLDAGSLIKCAKGVYKQHKGYKCQYFDEVNN